MCKSIKHKVSINQNKARKMRTRILTCKAGQHYALAAACKDGCMRRNNNPYNSVQSRRLTESEMVKEICEGWFASIARKAGEVLPS